MAGPEHAVGWVDRALAAAGNVDLRDALTREVVMTFVFGVLNGWASDTGASPLDVQAGMTAALVARFGDDPAQAVVDCHELIACTDRSYHTVKYSIIHRGIEGYFSLRDGEDARVRENLLDVLALVRAG